jgi:hypothetical protein
MWTYGQKSKKKGFVQECARFVLGGMDLEFVKLDPKMDQTQRNYVVIGGFGQLAVIVFNPKKQ